MGQPILNTALSPTLAGLRLDYLSWWQALSLFGVLAVITLLLGVRSLASLGPVRRWVALGARMAVLALAVLIIAGVRLERENEIVEVMVLLDASDSAQQVARSGDTPLREQQDDWLDRVLNLPDSEKLADDRIGVISFDGDAYVDQPLNDQPQGMTSQTRAVNRQNSGTNLASALQLAMASFKGDARHRIVVQWDGTMTEGDLRAAVDQAREQDIVIDVMPLEWEIGDEVMISRFEAPTWRREGEPFTLEVILTNTAATPARGQLRIEQEGQALDMDPSEPGLQTARAVELQPGRNKQLVLVDAVSSNVNVRRFRAIFEPERQTLPGGGTAPIGDAQVRNNSANAFTFQRGKGRVLYIDNTGDPGGNQLRQALAEEGIATDPDRVFVEDFPNTLVDLQGYDAIILANVPRGNGGLSETQQTALAQYVHDTGGGLVMIGGPEGFGAGGWQNSRVEEILPLNMDVPAKRQIPKGALGLIMHSTEMAQGNYWAEQCALKAVEVLNRRDEVGVVSYDWTGGGTQWDFPLAEKGDGSRVAGAIKNMQLGDMPDFDNAMNVLLYGNAQSQGLLASDARQKHVIIISDMDPMPPSNQLLQKYIDNQISISTVQVAGHGSPLQAVAKQLAEKTGGRSYGPIEQNPSQLPQIFIKEASIVRRSLIKEDAQGMAVNRTIDASGSDLMAGIDTIPPINGYVLTSVKESPLVELPLVVGEESDPIFAYWQTGLGKSIAWTSDAHNKWAAGFSATDSYQKFWAQAIRSVSRPPQSSDFEPTVTYEDGELIIRVEAVDENSRYRSELTITGSVMAPGSDQGQPITLSAVGPGVYERRIKVSDEGNYVVALSSIDPDGNVSALRAGASVTGSAELMDLRSDVAAAQRLAEETGGRLLAPFEASTASDLFVRQWTDVAGNSQTLPESRSPLPIWDWLIPILLSLILIDVAIRRIAWDWDATKATVAAARDRLRMVTATTREDVEALRQQKASVASGGAAQKQVASRRYEASGRVEGSGDLLADAKSNPTASKRAPAKGKVSRPASAESGGGMSSLMEAKRRAREKIEREKEERGD